jgi:hypothetical protein
VTEDEKIQDIAVAMIRRASMNPEEWRSTVIGKLHLQLREHLTLDAGELAVVSAFFSERSWYAFTTRRIVSHLDHHTRSLDPANGITAKFGNFKGVGGPRVETATVCTDSGATVQFEYETGKPSMAPIYASRYWGQKHPILHKLLSTTERELYKARNAS